MDPCGHDKDRLIAYLAGEMGPDEGRALEEEARACPSCRFDLEVHRMVVEHLEDAPAPPMPVGLREVLVRSAVQVRRDATPLWTAPRAKARGRVSWFPILCSGAGLAALGLIVFFLLPSGSSSSIDEMVVGGVGRGATAIEELMQLVANLQAAWQTAEDFLQRFEPLTRAIRTSVAAIGPTRWSLALFSVLAVIGILWRLLRSSQNRSVKHA